METAVEIKRAGLGPRALGRWARGVEPLVLGPNSALDVRDEWLTTRPNACRLAYVSDIHLRRSRSDRLCRQVMEAVTRAGPHAVLLGGDLVDHHSELGALGHLVATLGAVAPVFAVGGNHDRQVGMEKVHAAVQQAGGQWIQRSSALLTHGGRVIAVAGPESAPPVEAHVRVLCAHDPRIWRTARHAGYHLVLAGHLHGCQFVAWEYRRQLFPGALFYRYCCSSRHSGSARLVVSRGVTDLVPIRWKCPREVVLCYV